MKMQDHLAVLGKSSRTPSLQGLINFANGSNRKVLVIGMDGDQLENLYDIRKDLPNDLFNIITGQKERIAQSILNRIVDDREYSCVIATDYAPEHLIKLAAKQAKEAQVVFLKDVTTESLEVAFSGLLDQLKSQVKVKEERAAPTPAKKVLSPRVKTSNGNKLDDISLRTDGLILKQEGVSMLLRLIREKSERGVVLLTDLVSELNELKIVADFHTLPPETMKKTVLRWLKHLSAQNLVALSIEEDVAALTQKGNHFLETGVFPKASVSATVERKPVNGGDSGIKKAENTSKVLKREITSLNDQMVELIKVVKDLESRVQKLMSLVDD